MNNSINSKNEVNNTPNLIIKGLIGEYFPSSNGFLYVHKTSSINIKIMSFCPSKSKVINDKRIQMDKRECNVSETLSLLCNVLWSSKYLSRVDGLRTKIGGLLWV